MKNRSRSVGVREFPELLQPDRRASTDSGHPDPLDARVQTRARSNALFPSMEDRYFGQTRSRSNAIATKRPLDLYPAYDAMVRSPSRGTLRTELGEGRAMVAGDRNERRNVANAMMDMRSGYTMAREEDRDVGRLSKVRDAGKLITKAFISNEAVSTLPFLGNFISAYMAYQSFKRAKKLSSEKRGYNEEAAPIYNAEVLRQVAGGAVSVAEVADPTGGTATFWGRTGFDALYGALDQSHKRRMSVANANTKLNESDDPSSSWKEGQASRTGLANRRNDQTYSLARHDPEANQAFRDLLAGTEVHEPSSTSHDTTHSELRIHNAVARRAQGSTISDEDIDTSHALKPSDISRRKSGIDTFNSAMSELAHHSEVIREARGSTVSAGNIDTSHTLKPSDFSRQVASERAIRNLRNR